MKTFLSIVLLILVGRRGLLVFQRRQEPAFCEKAQDEIAAARDE